MLNVLRSPWARFETGGDLGRCLGPMNDGGALASMPSGSAVSLVECVMDDGTACTMEVGGYMDCNSYKVVDLCGGLCRSWGRESFSIVAEPPTAAPGSDPFPARSRHLLSRKQCSLANVPGTCFALSRPPWVRGLALMHRPVPRPLLTDPHAPPLPPGPALGQGSYGVVFRGTWQGRLVAVKVILCSKAYVEQVGHEVRPRALAEGRGKQGVMAEGSRFQCHVAQYGWKGLGACGCKGVRPVRSRHAPCGLWKSVPSHGL